MKPWQPKAVIFDMDGLLVDSEPVWEEAETALVEARGVPFDHAKREKLVGLRMDEFIRKLSEVFRLEDGVEALGEELTGRMLSLIPHKVSAKPGAAELLAYLRERGLPCAIASSSPLVIIDATVENLGWGDIFTVRCTADDVERGKPAPDVYLKTAEILNVAPAACLALEDSPNGARAAVTAGTVCYAVPDPAHTRPAAFNGITEYVFGSLYEVLEHLKDGFVR